MYPQVSPKYAAKTKKCESNEGYWVNPGIPTYLQVFSKYPAKALRYLGNEGHGIIPVSPDIFQATRQD